jgi:hypothetical protein
MAARVRDVSVALGKSARELVSTVDVALTGHLFGK